LRLARTASGAAATNLRGDAERLVERRARFHEPAHEPEVERTPRADRLAGEGGVHRRHPADRSREPEPGRSSVMTPIRSEHE
jgi:hypothetical protein